MTENGAKDLAILGRVGGITKIIDANMALLDLSVNPETLTYFYTNKEKNDFWNISIFFIKHKAHHNCPRHKSCLLL